MTRHLHIAMIITALILTMSACDDSQKARNQLEEADSLLARNLPDSALITLHFISGSSMDMADSAYYGLLLTEARYRLFLPAHSDTLIGRSLDYYLHEEGNGDRLARAYYYSAMVSDEMKRTRKAMGELRQAEQLTRNSENTDLRHKVYESLAYFYGKAHDIDSAMRYSKISLAYAKATGEKDWEASALDYIANCFMEKGHRDSAYIYANKCLSLLGTMTAERQSVLLADIGTILKDDNPKMASDLLLHSVQMSIPLHHRDEELLATQFKLRQEQIEHRTEIHRLYYAMTAVVLFFALVLLSFYYRRHRARARHTIRQYQGMIENFQHDISNLEESGKDSEREVSRLKEKIEGLRDEQTDMLMSGHKLYEALKNGGNIVEWRKGDFVNFIEFYRLLDAPFVKHLEDDYTKLSPKYMLFVILHHNGASDDEIQRIFAVGASTIRTTKTRIRAKKVATLKTKNV